MKPKNKPTELYGAGGPGCGRHRCREFSSTPVFSSPTPETRQEGYAPRSIACNERWAGAPTQKFYPAFYSVSPRVLRCKQNFSSRLCLTNLETQK